MKESDFLSLLVQLSDEISKKSETYVDMLKVLYKELVDNKSNLEKAKSAIDLFKLLIARGFLKATDISVLFETIKVTGLSYLQKIIENYEAYPDEVDITQFSSHRQQIVALGNVFSVEDIQEICKRYQCNFSNPWKLVQHLEDESVLTVDNMPIFHRSLQEKKKKTKEKKKSEDFHQLLLKISKEINSTSETHVDMLRVLYTDFVKSKSELENAKCAFDLFKLLYVAAILKPTDISVLFETIELTGWNYLSEIIIETYKSYPAEVKITKFSEHRQHVFAFGNKFVNRGLQSVCRMYSVPVKIRSNPWKVLTFLENDEIISEKNWSSFVLNYEEICRKPSPKKREMCDQGSESVEPLPKKRKVDEGNMEASTIEKQLTDQDSIEASPIKRQKLGQGNMEASPTEKQLTDQDLIRNFVTTYLKQWYKDANLMTPSIWNEECRLDIAEVFTELILLQSERQVEGAQTKSTSKNKEGRPTSLRDVLSIIETRDPCKVLITGKGGMGKTTLLRYIAHKWATDDEHNVLAGKLLFLINIRSIGASAHFLDVIMKQICTKEFILTNKFPSDSVETFLVSHADEIVLLLDGYDELEKDSKDPIILFRGLELKKSTVVLTSRPENTADLVKCCDVHIKVDGFSSENIKKYIQNHFHSINESELGESLIKEFGLEGKYPSLWGEGHPEAFQLCSSPLLLLKICTIWEQKQHLPKDMSDLFKELFCCILSQYICKRDNETAISEFDRIPKRYKHAIFILGKCLYEGLKENKLTIDKYVLANIGVKEKQDINLALKLGFVYKDTPVGRGDVRIIYTTPNKLLSEALAGYYLSELKWNLEADEYEEIRSNEYLYMTRMFTIGFLGAKAAKMLKHWLRLRASNYYSISQCFRYIKEENEESVLQELDNNMSPEMKEYNKQMCRSFKSVLDIDESELNMHLFKSIEICCIKYRDCPEKLEEKVISLADTSSDRSMICKSIAHVSVVIQELQAKKMVGNDFVENQHLLRYISKWEEKEIDILSAEMKSLQLKYSATSVTLNFIFNSTFLNHFLKHANLSSLHVHNFLTLEILSGVISHLHTNHVKLALTKLDISHTDLHKIEGKSLGKLFKIAPKLDYLNVNSCSLSGDILKAMITECRNSGITLDSCSLDISNNDIGDTLLGYILKMCPNILSLNVGSCQLTKDSFGNLASEFESNESGITLCKLDFSQNNLGKLGGKILARVLKILPKLSLLNVNKCCLSGSIFNEFMVTCGRIKLIKDNMLRLEGNNLSDINGKSLAKLVRVTYNHYGTFRWSDYSLTADNLENLVNSVGVNGTLNLKWIDLSRINLSSISGTTLACLIKISTNLVFLDMSYCRLNGRIVNEMIAECCLKKVMLKENMLRLEGNNLSSIDGKSLAELVNIICYISDSFKWGDYFLTADNLKKLIESRYENMKLKWKRIELSSINLSLITGSLLAWLFKISPGLVYVNMSHCGLHGSIVNEMMEECGRLNVELEDHLLKLEGNNISITNGKSLAMLLRVMYHQYDTLRWGDYFLTANNLESLVKSLGENDTYNFKKIDFSGINLSSISGKTIACLIKVSTDLTHIDMSHCNVSWKIVNEMMKECSMMKVALKDNMLILDGNDLSNIDGKSLANLDRLLFHDYDTLGWKNYSLTAGNLKKLIESLSVSQSEVFHCKKIDFSRINLSSTSGKILACIFKISDLTHIDMRHCSLSGNIINEMMEECGRMNVVLKHNLLNLDGNDLSHINGKSLAKLSSVLYLHYDTFRWSEYSLTTVNLKKLVESIGKNERLNLKRIDLSGIKLSSIIGKTLACLFKISPDLIHVDMSHCSLTGKIVNEMMKECSGIDLKLKDNMLRLEGNDLSDIDGESLAELVRVNDNQNDAFRWSAYSLTAASLEKLVKSVGENETLNWKWIEMSNINLSSISKKALASLFKISPHLICVDMNHCSLSGSIMKEMFNECGRNNVILKNNMLRIVGNNLSDIDGESLAELVSIIYQSDGNFTWRNYSLTAHNLKNLVESVGGNGVLNLKMVDFSGIDFSLTKGKKIACFLKICIELTFINMSNCSLSGSIVNKMIEGCGWMSVVLKDNMLNLECNDLSDIDGKSLAELVKAWRYNHFLWSDCSLTADNLEQLVESVGENEKLNWKVIYLNKINLSSISGRTLACLFKISPNLIHIDMSHCSLSVSIVNEMREECCRMNVVLKEQMFNLKGNDLSDIDGKSLAALVKAWQYNHFVWSDYCLTADNLKQLVELVESVDKNEKLNLKSIDLSMINLSSISGRTLACLFNISPDPIHIYMSNCSLSGNILNEMVEQCGRMNVVLKDNMLTLVGNDLSDIDGKSLAELVSAIHQPDGNFTWSYYSFTADNLKKLVEPGVNVALNWTWIDISRIDLSGISGATLACLVKVSIDLIHIDMSNCSLSGSIVNEMIEECGRMNFVLKNNMLNLEGNDLSDINGKELSKLARILYHHHETVRWSAYYFTADNIQKLVESVGENYTVNWKKIELSMINLSSISGEILARFFKICSDLIHIYMSNCSLSGNILNEMVEQCGRRNVVLKDKMLNIEGNDFSDINSRSLKELIRIAYEPNDNFTWSYYSLTTDNLENLVESVGENMTFNWKRINLSGIDLSSVSETTLAYL